jgi:hypothetical protein
MQDMLIKALLDFYRITRPGYTAEVNENVAAVLEGLLFHLSNLQEITLSVGFFNRYMNENYIL